MEEYGLTAYRTGNSQGFSIVPAWRERDWMNSTPERFAKRCLPMLIANQSGWFITSGQKIDVWWTGLARTSDVRIRLIKGSGPCLAESHFGHGILTWRLPFLFRTSGNFNLVVRGPANMPKDGIQPLEGVVETDWASSSFTMNWKITRRFRRLSFDVGEPICFLAPQRRGELEKFSPTIADISADTVLEMKHRDWADSRQAFNSTLRTSTSEESWQKHYFSGRHASDNSPFLAHQSKLKIAPFGETLPELKPDSFFRLALERVLAELGLRTARKVRLP